jgi:hypothetical protein
MKTSIWLLPLAFLAACVPNLAGAPCETDANCPSGMRCVGDPPSCQPDATATGGGEGTGGGSATGGGTTTGGGGGGGVLDAGIIEGPDSTCSDGLDNDADGEIDCADADCNAKTCRVAGGACDVAETCALGECPADEKQSPATVCRPATDGGCDQPENCDGTSNECPTDVFVAMGTSCREASGACDRPESCTGSSAECPADQLEPVTTLCRAAAGDCDLPDFCSGTSPTCGADQLRPSSDECRASAGDCDLAERCTGSSPVCPADAKVSAGVECRAAGGLCDAAESCDGLAVACPSDRFRGAGESCRAAAGPCDLEETCSGSSPDCAPDGFALANTVCRAAVGACDVAERCSGTEAACPSNVFEPPTVTCRPASGACDTAERCDGNGACPSDVSSCQANQYCDGNNGCVAKKNLGAVCATNVECGSNFCANGRCCNTACNGGCEQCDAAGLCGLRPVNTQCRASAGPCDVAETCTGLSPTCPADQFATPTVTCRASAAACDAPETCTGTSAGCPADALRSSTFVCRASGGTCDPQELCTGTSSSCPVDVRSPANSVCRASAGPCDTAEVCNGSAATCPSDVFQPNTTSCGAPNCSNGVFTPAPRCTGSSNTCQSFANTSCNGFQCNSTGTACLTTCGTNTDCLATHYCLSGSCVPKRGDGQGCVNNTDCVSGSCLQGWEDADNDLYGNPGVTARFCTNLPSTYAANNTDCCDSNANVRPNQTSYFTTAVTGACSSRGFDWNCSGTSDKQYTNVNGCTAGTCAGANCTGSGWVSFLSAACGSTADYRTCTNVRLICSGGEVATACGLTNTSPRTQACR